MQGRRPGFDRWVGTIPWRREWPPTPVFLPGESHGQRSLAGYSPWGRKQWDMTELLSLNIHIWRLEVTDGSDISCLLLRPEILSFQSTPGDLWLGRSPGEGNDYALQYSCLENSMDRGAWRATVHGVAKSQTQLSNFHFHTMLTI